MLKKIKSKLLSMWEAGAFHIVSGSFLNKFVVFFGSIIIVRILTKAEYGELGYIENLYNFLYLFSGLGMSNAVLRFVILEESSSRKNAVYN